MEAHAEEEAELEEDSDAERDEGSQDEEDLAEIMETWAAVRKKMRDDKKGRNFKKSESASSGTSMQVMWSDVTNDKVDCMSVNKIEPNRIINACREVDGLENVPSVKRMVTDGEP